MNINRVLRYLVLILSAAAMVAGVMIMVGMLVPRNAGFGEELRIVSGGVVFLYGLYRFLVSWYRRPSS